MVRESARNTPRKKKLWRSSGTGVNSMMLLGSIRRIRLVKVFLFLFLFLFQILDTRAVLRIAGGSLGWKTRGSLDGAFEKTAYELEPSSTGNPKYGEVKTGFGYHIIMVEGRK